MIEFDFFQNFNFYVINIILEIIFIFNDYYKENNLKENAKKLNKNGNMRNVLIYLKNSKRDFDANPIIQFKFIFQNRSKHNESMNKFNMKRQ